MDRRQHREERLDEDQKKRLNRMTERLEDENENGGEISSFEDGDSTQACPGDVACRPQDHNILIEPLERLWIQSPDRYTVTTDQRNGGTIVAPNIVGTNIAGGVTMNLHLVSQSTPINEDETAQKVKNEIKALMKRDSGRILEGCELQSVSLNKIYTELFIISDESDSAHREHEFWPMETTHHFNTSAQTVINYNEVLRSPLDNNDTVKTVLTEGIAGIGKTVTVQKFVHDWANGKASQDLEFVFLLPFRELNLHDGEKSLFDVLCVFYPQFKKARQMSESIFDRRVLFILDGLDEYKKPLNFQSRLLSSVTEAAAVDVLLVNLLRGKLLPSAHLWITSRPITAGQLPAEIFTRGYKTQIRGFSDEQKQEYFTRQFEDPRLTREIICHLRSQKSLWMLCQIPLFCWISSAVLKDIIKNQTKERNMPSMLTEMYIHYLLIQTGLNHKKYQGEDLSQEEALQENKELIMKLAELAYWKLMEQNAIFSKEDLRKYNISVSEESQYHGVLTCILESKFGYKRTRLFSFVHLSMQAFFAALFAFREFLSGNQDSLNLTVAKNRQNSSLSDFLKDAVDAALQSENGHLDLFTRFLCGISCDSNRCILDGFLPPFSDGALDHHKKVSAYIKTLRRKSLSSERHISLVPCLVEVKDMSFSQMGDLKRSRSKKPLTLFQSTLLAFQFLMSDTKHDEFNLRKYNITLEGFQRFCPAITCFRKALLKGSGLTEQHCKSLMGYLSSPNSYLTDLDLSHNGLGRSALTHLSAALCDSSCQIQVLNLSHNDLQSQDMELIRDELSGRNLNLKVLDLSENPLGDLGVKILSSGLQSANCRLEVLKLSGCQIKVKGVQRLVSSLKGSSSCLKEVDLRYNDPANIRQESLKEELPSLRISTGGVCGPQPGLHKYAVRLTFDPQTANEHLHLNEDHTTATRRRKRWRLPSNAKRFDRCSQVLSHQPLSERCFFTVDVIGEDVHVGVACECMERKGSSEAVHLGCNQMSWSLCCSKKSYVARHDKKTESLTESFQTESIRRLGVFVDREAGCVCFYSLRPQPKLLYMFDADFPKDQDLHAAFKIQTTDASVSFRAESCCKEL